jgi:hypothetical protein
MTHRRTLRASSSPIEPLEPRRLLSALGPRQMEYLNRGVIAVNRTASSAYVSWRLLATDPSNIAFNVYRSANGGAATKLNPSPLTTTTDYTDNSVNESLSNAYFVKPVINGVEQTASESWTIAAGTPVKQYLSIPLTPPPVDVLPDGSTYVYNANDASVGDLDGDGQYEIILKWDSSISKDSSQDGFTGSTYYDAYKLDGTRLWRINLGQNIRAGAHYTQFMVYDFDGDGKAEVVMKTAPGTIDGAGNAVLMGSDQVTDDYRNATTGRINTGPEYLTVFNGQTGAAMSTVAFKPDRINTSSWGDDYGNRQDRILMAVAYLDGTRPSLVVGRGLFPGQSSGHAVRNELTAWDWRNGALTMRWWFRADQNTSAYGLPNINTSYIGQGNYEMHPADVDGDGKDEIVYGSMTVDDNGAPLYSTGLGHGDALFVTDADPTRIGEEVYMPMESPGGNGHITANVHTGSNGAVNFATYTTPVGSADPDVGRGNIMDIDPRYSGMELWDSYNASVFNVDNTPIQSRNGAFVNFGVWWDADPLRELLDGTTISDWRITNGVGGRSNYDLDPATSGTQSAPGATSNNGTKSTPSLTADIFGDWREEVIWRTADNTQLRIFTTTIAATNRYVTLMHDTQYRESVAWQNVGYNQPTNTSFFLGAADSSSTPSKAPMPNIYTVPFGGSAINVPVCIRGQVFEDTNDDGIKNGAEKWINDAVVYIDVNNNGAIDSGEQAVATDTQGLYQFTGLVNGTYSIRTSLSSEFATGVGSATYTGSAVTVGDLPMERINYSGGIGADSYLVRKNASGKYEVLLNGSIISTLSASIPSLTFKGLIGDDVFFVDGINGTPIPASGISLDGAAGNETIAIKGTAGADTLTFANGSVTFNGGKISSANAESISFTGQGGADSVTVNGGLQVALPDFSIQSVMVNSGGSVKIPNATSGGISTRTINGLTVNSGGTLVVSPASSPAFRTLIVTSNLTVNGLIDLASNDMIVHGGNVQALNGKIAAGANLVAGYWNGPTGISSSSAAADATKSAALGVLRNDNGAGGTLYPSFDGQPSSFGDVLIKYTTYGDADLNGSVNAQDFSSLAQNFNTAGAIWSQGDFNYDGRVNAIDFNALASRFGTVIPAPPLAGPLPFKATVPMPSSTSAWFNDRKIAEADASLLTTLSLL